MNGINGTEFYTIRFLFIEEPGVKGKLASKNGRLEDTWHEANSRVLYFRGRQQRTSACQ
jgi:hypothetical protein